MNFVLDCSFAMTWVLSDEATPATDKVLDSIGQGAKGLVPSLWHWEIANVLLHLERRKRATKAEVRSHLLFFQSLPIKVDEASLAQAWTTTHLLAQKHNLTSYDAAYLELAIRRGLPLATLDADLQAAAKAERVKLLAGK